MKKLTKANIEQLAQDVMNWAAEMGMGYDYTLFYNGKRLIPSTLEKDENGDYRVDHTPKIEEVNARDWCEYFPTQFIFGMAYDGDVYRCINGYERERAYDKLMMVFEKYGLYLEHLDGCHAALYPLDDDMEIEYTILPDRPKEYDLYGPGRCMERWTDEAFDYPAELDAVMELWLVISKYFGDHDGYCIIGEHVRFEYKGVKYRMHSQSIYQGNIHFRKCAEYAKRILERMGAKDVYIDEGMID